MAANVGTTSYRESGRPYWHTNGRCGGSEEVED